MFLSRAGTGGGGTLDVGLPRHRSASANLALLLLSRVQNERYVILDEVKNHWLPKASFFVSLDDNHQATPDWVLH